MGQMRLASPSLAEFSLGLFELGAAKTELLKLAAANRSRENVTILGLTKLVHGKPSRRRN